MGSSDKRPLLLLMQWICFFIIGGGGFSLIYNMYVMEEPTLKPWYFSHLKPNQITNDKQYSSSIRSNLLDTSGFDINGDHVMVFIHIQKTGGTTFGKHLVKDLELEESCVKNTDPGVMKRYNCFRPNTGSTHWLFSRFTTGLSLTLMLGRGVGPPRP